jgi:hypothetical protein
VLVNRFPVSVGVLVGIAVAVTGAAYVVRAPVDETMLATRHQVLVAHVRGVFADYGVRLPYTSHPSEDVTVLAAAPPPWLPPSLYVSVPREGAVTVHYGGSNERVRARLEAAAAALR